MGDGEQANLEAFGFIAPHLWYPQLDGNSISNGSEFECEPRFESQTNYQYSTPGGRLSVQRIFRGPEIAWCCANFYLNVLNYCVTAVIASIASGFPEDAEADVN